MRVHVSADMEGVAGVATMDQVVRGGIGYARAQELMTEEVNAAVRGAFDGGATEVVVSDSHGTMDNLLHARLDPRAELVFGAPRASCMVSGLTEADDAVVFLGYHAGAGCPGVLSHTFSAWFTQVRLDGEPVTEAEVNATYAAWLGVPVAVLTGDDEICRVAGKALPGTTAVQVKSAVGWAAAQTLSPERARARVQEAVATALAALPAPLPRPGAMSVEVDLAQPLLADLCATVPGTVRVAGATVQREVRDAAELLQLITAWYSLTALGAQQVAGLALRR